MGRLWCHALLASRDHRRLHRWSGCYRTHRGDLEAVMLRGSFPVLTTSSRPSFYGTIKTIPENSILLKVACPGLKRFE